MNGDRDLPENGAKPHSDAATDGRDSLERLLQIAGPRSNPPAWMEYEVRAATRKAWLGQHQARIARRRFVWAALAASALIAGGLALRFDGAPGQAVPASFRVVVASQGESWIVDESGASQPGLAAGAQVSNGTRLRTGTNGSVSLLRQDGASIRLDGDTELLVDAFDRLRLDAGALYFDSDSGKGAAWPVVAKNPDDITGASVAVLTPFGVARDLGTQFELRLQDEALRLRVREGRVSVEQQASAFEASAGEQLNLRRDGTASRSAFSPYDPSWDWAEALAPHFDIDGRPVIEYLRWVARETGRKLQFRSAAARKAAGEKRFYGTIEGFAPKDSLRPVLATTRFRFELTAEAIVIDLPPADL